MNQTRIDELRQLCSNAENFSGNFLSPASKAFYLKLKEALPEALDEIEALYAIISQAVELLAESFDFWSARNVRDNAEKIKEIKALTEIVKTPL